MLDGVQKNGGALPGDAVSYKARRKRFMQKSKARKAVYIVLLLAVLALILWRIGIPLVLYAQRQNLTTPQLTSSSAQLVSADNLSSDNAILIRRADGQVLMEKNADQRIYPASMTKIMTVMLALENIPLPDRPVHLDKSIFSEMRKAGASMAGFSAGQWARTEDLLYGALLPSGGECAVGLAKAMAGSEKAFAGQMNEKAHALGMTQTHFVNATGLHDKNHVSTVRDMAELLDYALEDPVFYKIFTTDKHRSTPLDPWHPGGILLKSTLFYSGCDTALPNGAILGGKTGTTDEAGYCLASLAKISGKEYILVTAHAAREGEQIADARTVYGAIPS